MIIAIEGPDGVGKTTIAKAFADAIGFSYVDKPLHFMFEDASTYQTIKNKLNEIHDKSLSAWFYGLNYLYCEKAFKDKNIVCDRYIFSNYSWIYEKENEHIFDALIKTIEEPFITFLLVADKNTAKERMMNRNHNDKDLYKIEYFDKNVSTLHYLAEKSGFFIYELDTTHLDVKSAVDTMLKVYENRRK